MQNKKQTHNLKEKVSAGIRKTINSVTSDRRRLFIVSGIILLAVIIVIIIAVAAGKNEKEKETETYTIVETEPEATAESYAGAGADVIPLTADGPVFPNLDLEVLPTEEPAPELLKEGTEHPIVAEVQQRLMDLGFMDFDEPTEYYGNATKAAIMKFQRQNELEQDGVVGPDTLEMLFAEDAKYYAAKKGDTGEDIRNIQERLYQLGYLAKHAMVTGKFGEKTEEAVMKLQEVNGLSVDGKVGRQTYNLIYSDEVAANFLSMGEQSDVVLACQQRLFDLGYMTSTPDGTYGNDTYYAVKNFQSKNALVVDGFLGPTTKDILMSSKAVHNGLGLGDSNEQVAKVQALLVKYEYLSKKNATGYFGEITQKAVKNFQKQNGLSQDGMVGAQTLAKLTSDKAKKAAKGMLDGANFSKTTTNKGTSSSGGSSAQTGGTTQGSGTDAGSVTQTQDASTIPNTDSNGVSGSVSNLLAVARSKIGCPYVWGSKGPNSFDCSGFVNWVLNQCGVSQSYITSAGWRNVGKYTRIGSYSDLRAGDVIVVNGHVGFISTGGCVIDASSSNGRVIERGLGSWWANHFIVGWRIF